MKKGKTLAQAVAAEKVALPRPQEVAMGREDLARIGKVPPILALMFSMAEGTTKRLEAPQEQGWFVASRSTSITLPKVEGDDPIIGADPARSWQRCSATNTPSSSQCSEGRRRQRKEPGGDRRVAIRQLTGKAE